MKKLISLLAIGALAVAAQASSFTFQPTDTSGAGDSNTHDLQDLDHGYYYTWGIYGSTADNLIAAVKNGEHILSATISIKNIYNWTAIDPTNVLNVNLLDDTTKGAIALPDTGNGVGNQFGTTGWIGSWTDSDGPITKGFGSDTPFVFSAANIALLESYLIDSTASGKAAFGLGFDPDCHYFNDGVSFVVTTGVRNVPEGGLTLSLLGLGLVALVGVRRRVRR